MSAAENPVTASLKVIVTVNGCESSEFPGALRVTVGRASVKVVKVVTGVDCVELIEFVAVSL
jgi:hypothetical protein